MGKESINSKEPKDVSAKKRKKELPPSSSAKVQILSVNDASDVYKDAMENEEEESLKRDSEGDLNLFCNMCDEFKKLMSEINTLKWSNSQQATKEIAEKRVQASLLFVLLKKLNRFEKFRTFQMREKLHKAKLHGDSCHLQLQNLLYEGHHLEKEITKCLQFKSRAEEIDLVPVEEFYTQAPESITRPEVTKSDNHQLKLARLEWELEQRKQLAALCHDLQAEKEKVAAEISKKQAKLKNLAPMLKDVLNVASPVQQALGLTLGPSPSQQKTAQLLPHPLYFLFVHADALREAGDKSLVVKIEGDEEDALRLKQTVVETATLDDSDSDTQEEVVGKRHGHRKKSRQVRLDERRKQLVMAHPLTVTIVISLKDGLGSINLQFSYLVHLHIVTVKPKVRLSSRINISNVSSVSKLIDSANILMELFPDDFGETSPNTANTYQLKQVGMETLETTQLGLPYLWAQRVAGLSFSSEGGSEGMASPSRQVSLVSVPDMVTAVKKRLSSRIALCLQIQALEGGKVPDTGLKDLRSKFPCRLLAELGQWTPVSWDQYQALGFTQQVVAQGFVSHRDWLYRTLLTRGNARLIVAVAIKNSYPEESPVFSLQATYENKTIQASNNDSIRDIEREINVFDSELVSRKNAHSLLTALVLRLKTCFDILLEASTNQEFPRDKIFLQSNRGRNRAWPFKQIPTGDGVFHFTQR